MLVLVGEGKGLNSTFSIVCNAMWVVLLYRTVSLDYF